MNDLKPHPLADLFPRMERDDFLALRDDIAANGCHTPIVLYEGAILDGRHRYDACRETSQPFVTNYYTDADPLGFVLSLNLHRRQLSVSQRAAIAAELANMSAGRPETMISKEIITDAPVSIDKAADALHVSAGTVRRAVAVKKRDATAFAAIKDGTVTVGAAAAALPKPEPKPVAVTDSLLENARQWLLRLMGADYFDRYCDGECGALNDRNKLIDVMMLEEDDDTLRRVVRMAEFEIYSVRGCLRACKSVVDKHTKLEAVMQKCIQNGGSYSVTVDGFMVTVTART